MQPLKFVVVGGSIAGLACAFALQRAGHQVLVLEQTDGKRRSKGGIRSPPNMTRLLNDWGLSPILAEMTVKCREFRFLQGNSGERIGSIPMHAQLMKALRADFLFIQHADLHDLFLDLATKAGVTIRYNSKIVQVDAWNGTVVLESGARVSGDIIVGADGYKSVVRPLVTGDVVGTPDRRVSLSFSVSTDLMRQDEDLRELTESPDWTIWCGNDSSVYGYVTHGKREYGMVLVRPDQGDPFDQHWNDHYAMDDLNLNADEFEPRVRKLICLAETFTPTKHVIHDHFDSWVHESGRIVLVGDAAHPAVPSGTHAQALAIEDAAVLGGLFARLRHRSQVPLLLSAYEELRQHRCAKTQDSERQKRDFIAMPAGPAADARNAGMRALVRQAQLDWDDSDEEYLRETYGDLVEQYAYDANEAVDDWWTKWGPLLERYSADGITTPTPGSASAIEMLKYEVSVMREGSVPVFG